MTRRHNILINGLSAVWGGGVVYLRHLLRESDLKITFIANAANQKDFGDLAFGRNDLEILWVPAQTYLQKLAFYLREIPRLCADKNIGQLFEPANIVYHRPPGVRTLLKIQNLAPWCHHPRMEKQNLIWKARWSAIKTLTVRGMKLADKVLFLSRWAHDKFHALYPHLRNRFHPDIIYHGVPEVAPEDSRGFEEFRVKHRIHAPFIFTPSHLLWYKNIETVIDALSELSATGHKLQYVVAGNFTTPDYHRYLVAKIQRAGLEQQVLLPGEVNRSILGELYRRCELVAFPSLVENMPFTLLEAMGYGCPIIAGHIGVMPEVVGDSALLAPATLPAAWAKSITRILHDSTLKAILRQRATARAKDFTWARSAGKMRDIFLDYAKEKK